MSSKNYPSPFSGLAAIIVVLVIIGAVVGLALSGTDIFNFITNPTKAQILKNQSDLEFKKAEFDFAQYQQRETAQTASDIAIVKAQAEAAAQVRFVWNEILRLAGFAGVGIVVLAALTGIYLFAARIKAGLPQPIASTQAKLSDPWQNPDLRAKQIKLARRREQALRTANFTDKPRPPKTGSRPEDGEFITIFKN